MTPEEIAKNLVEDPLCSCSETDMELAITQALYKQREACANAANEKMLEIEDKILPSEVYKACLNAEPQ